MRERSSTVQPGYETLRVVCHMASWAVEQRTCLLGCEYGSPTESPSYHVHGHGRLPLFHHRLVSSRNTRTPCSLGRMRKKTPRKYLHTMNMKKQSTSDSFPKLVSSFTVSVRNPTPHNCVLCPSQCHPLH